VLWLSAGTYFQTCQQFTDVQPHGTRYNRGNHANPATHAGEGREWERDTDLGYTVQSGPLKNVSMLWRNATLRSNYQRDIDENRLILTYTLPLF